MIKKDTYPFISKLKSHTESTVRENQKQFLPVLNTGKIFNTKKYHYLDRWYSYAYSADESEKTYSIIYVENMPYRSLYKRKSKQSFTASIERMIFDKELVPFMLFINNRFVPWNCIDIIHDYDDTYLKVHGEQYNYHYITDVKMLVLPYNISCLCEESDYIFNSNYEALCDYINASAKITNDKLYVNLPEIDTDYNYKRNTYNIGYWMYNQIKLKSLGLLSKDRIDKLRKISIQHNTETTAYNTTINVFDRDSYIQGVYDSICNINKNNVLFKFNNNGELDNNGKTVIYCIDDNEVNFKKYTFNAISYIGNEKDNDSVFFEENYLLFKNGCICNDYKITTGKYNNFKIYDIDKTIDYTLDGKKTKLSNNCVLYRISSNTSYIISHNTMIPNRDYLSTNYSKYFSSGTDNLGYLDKITEPLDFSIDTNKVYDDNFNSAFNTVLNYNPLLFNKLYSVNVISKSYTGIDANNKLFVDGGIKIPRNYYDLHEVYAMVFVNGELINRYDEMVVSSNYLFIPVDNKFKAADEIEIVYYLHINNNELEFTYTKNAKKYIKDIPTEDLKLFSTNVKDLLLYPEIKYNFDNISFPVDDDLNKMNNRIVTAVSSRKFIYQKLNIDRKAYKILLDKRFRYCSNQKQYCLFLNGRKVPYGKYLITIPKLSRPFDEMYIYSTKFFKPTDRIELFYLPEVYDSVDTTEVEIKQNGYIVLDKKKLKYPLNSDFYMFFANGKKINSADIITVSTNIIRLSKDINTTNALDIYSIVKDGISEVSNYISSNNKSKYESLIDYIKDADSLGYDELDTLFMQITKISNTEAPFSSEVARIAIINEIVRDFWVTSGYDYNAKPFIYDYELDDYITKDDNDNYIIPAMDALPEINIIKYDLHYLSFSVNDATHKDIFSNTYLEYGDSLNNPVFKWEYNDNYNTEEIEYQKLNDITIAIEDDYEYEYQLQKEINMKNIHNEFILEASNGFNTCTATINIDFCNSIYYGLVDEDKLDSRDSDIYHKNPTQLLRDINKLIKPDIKMDLNNFIIGSNKYFIFAAPKRLVYNGNKLNITFYLPDIKNDDIVDANNDNKTKPIFTNGIYETEIKDTSKYTFIGGMVSLDKYSMEIMTEFKYTNEHGYAEDYVIFKSNGFFTRLYEDTEFNINIR